MKTKARKRKGLGGKSRREKGLKFEQWVARSLRAVFPDARRLFENQRGVGHDISHTGIYRIQCKRNRYPASISKIKEVKAEGVPVLVTKGDKDIPYAVIPFDHFVELLKGRRE